MVYLDLEPTVFEISLIFVQNPLLFVEFVSCLTVDMELQTMLHPVFIAFVVCQLGCKAVELIEERGFCLFLFFLLQELVSDPFCVGEELYLLVYEHFPLCSMAAFFCLLEIQLISQYAIALFLLKLSDLIQLFSLLILFRLRLFPGDLMPIGLNIELCCVLQHFILYLDAQVFIQLSLFVELLSLQIAQLVSFSSYQAILHLSFLRLLLLSLTQLLFQGLCINCHLIRQLFIFQHIMRGLYLVSRFLHFIAVESQTILFLEFFHFLLLFLLLLLLSLLEGFFLIRLLFLGIDLQIIKRVQCYLSPPDDRRIYWPIFRISVETLNGHQIVDSIAGYLPENRMFFIEVLTVPKSNEELRPIAILPSICHSNYSSSGESQPLIELIFERKAIDRLSTSACSGWISSLDHKSRNKTMKDSIFIVIVQAMLKEVSTGQRRLSCPQFDLQLTVRGIQNGLRGCRRFFLGTCLQIHYYKSIKKSQNF